MVLKVSNPARKSSARRLQVVYRSLERQKAQSSDHAEICCPSKTLSCLSTYVASGAAFLVRPCPSCPVRLSIFHNFFGSTMAASIDPASLTPAYLATDEGPRVLRTLSAITAISTVFFGLRIAVRLHRKNFGIGIDDWLLFAAVVRIQSFPALVV